MEVSIKVEEGAKDAVCSEHVNLPIPLSMIKQEVIEPEPEVAKCESNVIDSYEKKYFALLRRSESIQQNNERLVNRIYHIKRLLRRLRKERRFLMQRLDQYGDDYQNISLTLFIEEDNANLHLPSTLSGSNITSGSSAPSHNRTASHSGSGSKKKVRQEKEKDPNAPKRPANPFFLFCQDQRASVMERFSQEQKEEISHQELTKTLAKNWNSLSSDEKKPLRMSVYYDMYEKEKERYEQEMKAYSNKDNAGSDKG